VALPDLRAVPEVIREGVASIAYSHTLMAVLFSILHHIRAVRNSDAPVRLTLYSAHSFVLVLVFLLTYSSWAV
jgi:hypothetical protein